MLTPEKGIPDWKLFLRQFMNMFSGLLIVAGILSMVVYFMDTTQYTNLAAALALFFVVTLMAVGGFIGERKALRVIHGFAKMLPQQTTCVRNGRIETVEADVLVTGDIVVLRNGARVPADIRLIAVSELKLETSAMTGESEPLDSTAIEAPAHISAVDSHNIAFNSSLAPD
jgi:magnesium-transporting ATPase (P-type)